MSEAARLQAVPDAFDETLEAQLWMEFRQTGTSRQRERLFCEYQAFAKQIARRHYLDRSGGDIEFAELCQLAYAGLLEALDHYDLDRGVPFRGYAARRISGSILSGLAKTSEYREQLSFRRRIRGERSRSLGASVSASATPQDALSALAELAVGLALGFMLEGTTLYVTDDKHDTRVDAYETAAWKDTIRHIVSAVSTLPGKEQVVVRQHYFHGLDFSQIAILMALTRGRISQLHKAAMELLRKRLPRPNQFKLER